jgi:tetratricopeptide (TPR) repeat protein
MTAIQPPLPDFDSQWDFGKPAETESRFRAIQPQAEQSGNRAYLLELKTQIARTLGLQSRFDEAHAMLDSVEAELTPERKRGRIRYLLERGRVFNSSDHADKAKPLFMEAWELAKRSHEDNLAVDAAHMVAIVESGKSAEEWNLKALAFADKSRDPKARQWRASLYNNLGWTYQDAGRFKEALDVFRKALEAREERGHAEPTRIARWTVARCLRLLGRVKEALAMQQDQVTLFAAQKREPGPYVCEEMAECLYALGRTTESRPWFAKAYAALSKEDGLTKHEAPRLERLKRLGLEQDWNSRTFGE